MRSENATARTYGEWQGAFNFFNQALFDNKLPNTLISYQRIKKSFGYFSPERYVALDKETFVDEIAMNPTYFVNRTLEDILSTLVHEMCHQWQYRYGKKKSLKAYHNKEFALKMESIGLITSDTGQPGGKRVGQKMSHYIQADTPFTDAARYLIQEKGWRISFADAYIESGTAEKIKTPLIDGVDSSLSGFELGSIKEIPPKKNKSNREKYTCACDTNVWGKKGLVIFCGICKMQFKANEQDKTTEKKEEIENER